jgi:hypothetical protein
MKLNWKQSKWSETAKRTNPPNMEVADSHAASQALNVNYDGAFGRTDDSLAFTRRTSKNHSGKNCPQN